MGFSEDEVGRERGLRVEVGEADLSLRPGASGSPLVVLATAVLPPVLDPTLADLEWRLRGGMVVMVGKVFLSSGRATCTGCGRDRQRGRGR